MAIFEALDIRSLAEAEGVKIYTPEESAESIIANWKDFLENRDISFYAYFPLFDEHHELTLKAFGARLGFTPQIPEETNEVVISDYGRGELLANVQTYDDGTPYAIEYTGRKFEAIQ